jgi:hypothetical protein
MQDYEDDDGDPKQDEQGLPETTRQIAKHVPPGKHPEDASPFPSWQ